MNQDQILSLVRTTLASVSVWAITKGYGDSQTWAVIGGVAALVVPYLWGLYVHSDAQKINAVAAMTGSQKNVAFVGVSDSTKLAAVEAMPDVKAIVPVTGATGAVAAAVADPSRPKVIDASPAPPSSPIKPRSA